MRTPRILVVDDSRTVRSMLSNQLIAMKANVVKAKDGVEGYKLAQAASLDLIITDLDMPRMDGLELCGKLKAAKSTQGIPIIILSGNTDPEMVEAGFKAGVEAYISKDEANTELCRTIQDVLGRTMFTRDTLILVVDDSQFILATVGKGLAREGFRVLTAKNGREALTLLERHKPDLIISDLEMPVMDGFALIRAVRRMGDFTTTPYVVMSSLNDRKVMKELIGKGASSYLCKPFNVDQLVITVERLLSDHFLLLIKEKERLEMERVSMLSSITSLIQALEARDGYTRGHSESVAEISLGIAGRMELDEQQLERLEMAARLHDLGKIGIPDKVLLKEGKLTDEEYVTIQTHSTRGAEILRPILSLADIIPVVLSHHERMNGTGYPHGLQGTRIPLWARIIAVADVFHALTSNRPYRQGMPLKKAMGILEEMKGPHLCPYCVQTFQKWMATKDA